MHAFYKDPRRAAVAIAIKVILTLPPHTRRRFLCIRRPACNRPGRLCPNRLACYASAHARRRSWRQGAHLSRRHPACRVRANEGLSGSCRDAGRRDKDQAQVRRADAPQELPNRRPTSLRNGAANARWIRSARLILVRCDAAFN